MPLNIRYGWCIHLKFESICKLQFQIYKVEAITESPSCDHLYFTKHVYEVGNYKVGGMDASCHYNRFEEVGGTYYQTNEKLVRTSLMFSDSESWDSPANKMQVWFGFDKCNHIYDWSYVHNEVQEDIHCSTITISLNVIFLMKNKMYRDNFNKI